MSILTAVLLYRVSAVEVLYKLQLGPDECYFVEFNKLTVVGPLSTSLFNSSTANA